MNITDVLPEPWRPYAKAIVAGVGTLVLTVVGALLLVLEPGEALADVTLREWLVVAMTVFGGTGAAAGGAYGPRNDPPRPPRTTVHRGDPVADRDPDTTDR